MIIILTSCFLLLTSAPLALAHGGEHDELIIRITKKGFEPRELTVTAGDEVLFINNDDTDRWPASNFHPTHTLYPEFDPLRGIPPEESWTFTFEKPGTWRMHDHLFPHMTGVIVVLEDPAQGSTLDTDSQGQTLEATGFWAKIKAFFLKLFRGSKASTINEFKKFPEKEKYAWLEEKAGLESPETAWKYVKAAYQSPEGVTGNPHDMAHLVGQLLFKARGFEGLSTCDATFAFGCYHGLMEVAFDKDNAENYENNLLAAKSGCDKLFDKEDPTAATGYWSCIHGLGHGIATFRDHDMDSSVSDCDFLPESLRTYCQDGVFMEFSISAPESFYKQDSPLHPCDIVPENAKIACARSQSKVMMLKFGLEPEEVAAICLDSGSQNIIYHCVDSLGYYIGQATEGDEHKIIAGCNKIEDKPSAAQCLAAAAGELVFQNYAGWHDSVETICRSMSGEYRAKCAERVSNVKESYGRE